MNALLSIILCFAMLLGPAGALPAQPEKSTAWTVSNFTIDLDGESVSLPQQLQLATAIGAEEARLHFEIQDGETVYMPVSGAISADSLRFSLANGNRAYSLDEETLMELAGMTEDDAQILDLISDLFLSYGGLFALAKDTQRYDETYDLSWRMIEGMLGEEFVEAEIEVEGEMYAGYHIQGGVTLAGTLNMLDMMAECGIPEVEAFVLAFMELANASGMSISQFSDLAADLSPEELQMEIMEMDFSYVNGDFIYVMAETAMDMEGVRMTVQSESIVRGDNIVSMMVMEQNAEGVAMTAAYTMDCTGPVYAPTLMDMSYYIFSEQDSGYTLETEDGVSEYIDTTSIAMNVMASLETIDDLKSGEMEIILDTMGSYGFDDDVEFYEENVGLNFRSTEQLAADGGVITSCELSVDIPDMPIAVSFDVARAEGPAEDYFAGATEYPITADSGDEAYNMLMADAMAFAAQAMQLAADEDVQAMVDLFNTAELVVEEEAYTAEEYAEESDYESEYEASVYESEDVRNLEEAAEIFSGVIPAFTAPEGYELEYLSADENMVYASYYSEDSWFDFIVSDYGYQEETGYCALQDGKLSPIEGKVVEITEEEGVITGIEIRLGTSTVEFYVDDLDMAGLEALLAGLEL